MVRVELILPLEDQYHRDTSSVAIRGILRAFEERCGGYRISRIRGYWQSPDTAEEFSEEAILIVIDGDFSQVKWIEAQILHWKNALNQEQLYLTMFAVERL